MAGRSTMHLSTERIEGSVRCKMVERYVDEIKGYRNLVPAARARPINSTTRRGAHTKVILLTGSTGSLGCMLLSQFAADPTISKIICLNRPRNGAHEYQAKAMQKRGVVLKEEEWRKVVYLGSNTSQVNLGLDAVQYEDVSIFTCPKLAICFFIDEFCSCSLSRTSSTMPGLSTSIEIFRLWKVR